MNLKTNMGKTFLKLLQRHFLKRHSMHKIFNRNAVKISYCCMRNMESVILSRNKQILNLSKEYFGCNYKVRNKCLTPSTVYEAKVSNKTNNECKRYLGASETPFKERFRSHTRDFKHKKCEKLTGLSKYIWTTKSHGLIPIVKWSIVKRVNSKTAANYCKLYLIERFSIIQSLDDKNLLNETCRHQNKLLLLLLSNVKRNDTMDYENWILHFVFVL